MKLSTKSLSSPGRAEKLYPPPLMRFLRSNGGSRSRRSRSSPMFVRKKNTPNIETQEPSSPKVTCMGQVRVSRSKQSKTRPGKHKTRCSWIHCNPIFCRCRWSKKKHHKLKCFTPSNNIWRRWVIFFRCGFKRKSKIREDPVKVEPQFGDYNRNQERDKESDEAEDEEEPEDEDAKVYVSITPPKNALLLTRCRSAPYRSSSLAYRFWSEETEEKQSSTDQESREEDEDEAASVSASDSCNKESRLDQENEEEEEEEEKIEFLKEIEESIISINERLSLKAGNVEELSKEEDGIARPLLLTRCKSEPARTGGERLDPEIGFHMTD